MISARALAYRNTSLRLLRPSQSSSLILRATAGAFQQPIRSSNPTRLQKRSFVSSKPSSQNSAAHVSFIQQDPPHIRKTEPSWPHPIFSDQSMEAVGFVHRPTKNFSDRFALGAVRFLRTCMDWATGYKHEANSSKSQMTASKWLVRFQFLESVAGVPGMVGGMLRHLHSLRRLKRDNGWIESLLEEAFNERMHLLTFLKLQNPGLFMRTMILGAQGVFFNGFFLCYLISPKTCHRFVGYLEEEAVLTYTCAIEDLDAGRLPEWENMEAPQIAIEYWNMPEGKRTMRDLLLYVRADEAKHREVNHTLGNLNSKTDPNPFVSVYDDPAKPHPTKGLEFHKGIGWSREEAL